MSWKSAGPICEEIWSSRFHCNIYMIVILCAKEWEAQKLLSYDSAA